MAKTCSKLRTYYCSECWFYDERGSPDGGDCCTAPHNNKGVAREETERIIGDFWEHGCNKERAQAVHVVLAGAKACFAFKSFDETLSAIQVKEEE